VTDARGIYRLQLAVGLLGTGATLLVASVVANSVTLRSPGNRTLFAACQSFVLPHVSVWAITVLALGSFAFAVLGLAAQSGIRQLRASRRFLNALRDVRAARVGPAGTLVFTDASPQAFCAGLLRPRIYLSDATLELLAVDELDAVIAHEAHHARYRDPLRIFFARVLRDALFFLPVLRRLADRYAALAELTADAAAVRSTGNDPQPLASALLVFHQAASPAVVGIAPERVDHLLGKRPTGELPLALLAWAIVVVGAIVLVAVRTAQASQAMTVNLPLLAAQLCMVAMAVIPLIAGAGVVLASRRLLLSRGQPGWRTRARAGRH